MNILYKSELVLRVSLQSFENCTLSQCCILLKKIYTYTISLLDCLIIIIQYFQNSLSVTHVTYFYQEKILFTTKLQHVVYNLIVSFYFPSNVNLKLQQLNILIFHNKSWASLKNLYINKYILLHLKYKFSRTAHSCLWHKVGDIAWNICARV